MSDVTSAWTESILVRMLAKELGLQETDLSGIYRAVRGRDGAHLRALGLERRIADS